MSTAQHPVSPAKPQFHSPLNQRSRAPRHGELLCELQEIRKRLADSLRALRRLDCELRAPLSQDLDLAGSRAVKLSLIGRIVPMWIGACCGSLGVRWHESRSAMRDQATIVRMGVEAERYRARGALAMAESAAKTAGIYAMSLQLYRQQRAARAAS